MQTAAMNSTRFRQMKTAEDWNWRKADRWKEKRIGLGRRKWAPITDEREGKRKTKREKTKEGKEGYDCCLQLTQKHQTDRHKILLNHSIPTSSQTVDLVASIKKHFLNCSLDKMLASFRGLKFLTGILTLNSLLYARAFFKWSGRLDLKECFGWSKVVARKKDYRVGELQRKSLAIDLCAAASFEQSRNKGKDAFQHQWENFFAFFLYSLDDRQRHELVTLFLNFGGADTSNDLRCTDKCRGVVRPVFWFWFDLISILATHFHCMYCRTIALCSICALCSARML